MIGLDYALAPPPPSPDLLHVLLPPAPAPPGLSVDFALAPLLPPAPGAPLGTAHASLRGTGAWQGRAVGVLSSLAPAALQAEYSWAAHLGLGLVVASAQPFAGAAPGVDADAARALCSALAAEDGPLLCLRLPLSAEEEGEGEEEEGAGGGGGGGGSGGGADAARWRAWHALRALCRHNLQLGLCLEVGAHLPSPQAVARWVAEPVRLALLPTALFVPNAAGFPSLRPPHRALVEALLGAGVALAVSGAPQPALAGALAAARQAVRAAALAGDEAQLAALAAAPALAYTGYLRHLAASRAAPSAAEAELAPWAHALMAPLQPLAHNLASATYEVFERDAPKYEAYEAAVAGALRGLAAARGCSGGGAGAAAAEPLRVLVIGAGRGPLVSRALSAARGLGLALAVVALEKNPNAFRQLAARGAEEGWGSAVRLEACDARSFARRALAAGASAGEAPFHILLSELLGSFGDNELSPECLQPALPLLAPGVGVCIPGRYTSYLAPVTCPGLWGAAARASALAAAAPGSAGGGGGGGGAAAPDRAYVTRMPRALALAPPCAVFTFTHQAPADAAGAAGAAAAALAAPLLEAPPQQPPLAAHLEFDASAHGGALPALLHGFAGYFTAELFPGTVLSTLPSSHTPGMHSWFPLFLPLRAPVAVQPGARVALSVWRCSEGSGGGGGGGGGGRVWFEWALRAPEAQGLQNGAGASWDMRL